LQIIFQGKRYSSDAGQFAEPRGMVFVVSVSTGLFTGIPSTKKTIPRSP